MNKRRQRWMLAFLWMLVIFFLSAQSGNESGSLSNSLFKPLFDLLVPMGMPAETLSLGIRKFAHYMAYLILGVLVFHALDTYEIQFSQKVYLSMLLCFGYAISDEIHQLFVPGRAGTLIDIGIDTMGSATSMAYIYTKKSKEVRV